MYFIVTDVQHRSYPGTIGRKILIGRYNFILSIESPSWL